MITKQAVKTPVEVEPEIAQALQELRDVVVSVEERIKLLVEKVNPVLSPCSDKAPRDSATVSIARTDLGGKLYAQVYAIEAINAAIIDIINRCEL